MRKKKIDVKIKENSSDRISERRNLRESTGISGGRQNLRGYFDATAIMVIWMSENLHLEHFIERSLSKDVKEPT